MINDDDDDGHLSNDSKKNVSAGNRRDSFIKDIFKKKKNQLEQQKSPLKRKNYPNLPSQNSFRSLQEIIQNGVLTLCFFYVSIAAATTTFLGETRKKSTLRKMKMFTKMLKKILLLLPLILIEVNLLEQKSTYIPTIILLSLVAQD